MKVGGWMCVSIRGRTSNIEKQIMCEIEADSIKSDQEPKSSDEAAAELITRSMTTPEVLADEADLDQKPVPPPEITIPGVHTHFNHRKINWRVRIRGSSRR